MVVKFKIILLLIEFSFIGMGMYLTGFNFGQTMGFYLLFLAAKLNLDGKI
jgi:hypothetical protein